MPKTFARPPDRRKLVVVDETACLELKRRAGEAHSQIQVYLLNGTLRGVTGALMTRGKLLLLCDKAREILANTSSRFIQFRDVLHAMEGKANAKDLAAENTLLRAI